MTVDIPGRMVMASEMVSKWFVGESERGPCCAVRLGAYQIEALVLD